MRHVAFLAVLFTWIPAAGGPATTQTARVRVVYVLSERGAMTGSMPALKEELSRAVVRLSASDDFEVIGAGEFRTDHFAGKLIAASTETKRRFADFLLGFVTGNTANDRAAILEAISLRPDTIWLATAGFELSPKQTKEIDAASHIAHVKINTIISLDGEGEADIECQHNLWDLAHRNGGICVGIRGIIKIDPAVDRKAQPGLDTETPGRDGKSVFRDPRILLDK